MERRRALIANEFVILATVTISSTLTAVAQVEGFSEVLVGFLTYGVSTALALLLAYLGHLRIALYGHTAQVFLCNLGAFILLQDVPAHMVLAMVNFVLLHTAVFGRRSAMVTTILMVLCMAVAFLLERPLGPEIEALRATTDASLALSEPVRIISLLTTALSTSFLITTTVGLLESSKQAALDANRDLEEATVELRGRHEREQLLSEFGGAASVASSVDDLREALLGTLREGLSGHDIGVHQGKATMDADVPLEAGPDACFLRFEPALDDAAQRYVDTVMDLHAGACARMAAEVRLHEAERLESVGRLAASVAHDFNNLLVPVVSAAEAIRASAAADGPMEARAARSSTPRPGRPRLSRNCCPMPRPGMR